MTTEAQSLHTLSEPELEHALEESFYMRDGDLVRRAVFQEKARRRLFDLSLGRGQAPVKTHNLVMCCSTPPVAETPAFSTSEPEA